MKKKILLCFLCGVMLFSVTGCGSSNSKNIAEQEAKTPMIVSTPVTIEEAGVTITTEVNYIFTKEEVLDSSTTTMNVILDSDSDYTVNEMKKNIETTFDKYVQCGAIVDIKEDGKKIEATMKYNFNEITGDLKDEWNGYIDMSYDDVLDKLNESRNTYYYNPNNKEKVKTPTDIDGIYVDDLTGTFNSDAGYELTYKIVFNASTLFESTSDLDIEDYPIEYDDGIITIKRSTDYHETYKVKSNYKGYDLVFIDENNYEVFRGKKVE